MKRTLRIMTVIITSLVIAAVGCKRKDKDKKAPNTTTSTPKPATPTPTPAPKKVDAAKANAACADAFNAHDPAKFKACYAADAIATIPDDPQVSRGADAILAATEALWTAFPDIRGDTHLLLVSGNRTAALLWATGTNTGQMAIPGGPAMPATNQKTASYGVQFLAFNDKGQVTTETSYWDMALLMGQLQQSKTVRPVEVKTEPIEKEPVVAIGSGTEKSNIELIKAALAMVTANDQDGFIGNYTDGAVLSYNGAPADFKGKQAIKGFISGLMVAFPDMSLDVTEIWGAGDYVVAQFVAKGTNTGPMPPTLPKPTGKPLVIHNVEIWHLKDGKIDRQWIVNNGMSFAMQLGLMK